MRISEVDLPAGVSTSNKPPVILEHSAGAPGVQKLTLLTLVQVETDHLVLGTHFPEFCAIPKLLDLTWMPPMRSWVGL